jgi:drug/metabolite transporter (DMT)-like permease
VPVLQRSIMDKVVMPVPTREEVRRGILYMVLSVALFALVNALVKYQEAVYPVSEVVLFRSIFALLFSFVLVQRDGGFSILRTHRIAEHLGRGTLQFISMVCVFIAYHLMPLADAVAITFSSPLFLTVLSIPLLGEQVGRHRWAAVIVGFVGIMIMVQPGPGTFSLGAILALANSALSASVTIALRRMSLTERPATLVTYQAMVAVALSVLILPFGWVSPTWQGGLGLAAIGVISGLGQILWTQAFRLVPAAILAPFSYTSMIWSIGLGFLIWGDMPTAVLIGGACVVAMSGLYILYRETLRRQSQRPVLAAAAGDD